MAISKIIYKANSADTGTTWMDVTQDTVAAGNLLTGYTATGADGLTVNGAYTPSVATVEQKDVNFIDYDGTILYSYSAADFANLSALPDNPTHTGLTAQGWNWTLADAKTYVANYGKLWIGQMYVTTSGDTEIDIVLTANRLSPYLAIAVNGSVTVDWGDNSTASTITGSSSTTAIQTLHNYSAEGAYTIKISVNSGLFALKGCLTKNSGTAAENYVYANAVKSIRLGTKVNIATNACTYCYSLKSISIPSSISAISGWAFEYCSSLLGLVVPSGITTTSNYTVAYCRSLSRLSLPASLQTIGNYFASDCLALSSITIPSSVTTFGSSAFYNAQSLVRMLIPPNTSSISGSPFNGCNGLGEIHFEPTTPPTISSSTAFSGVPTDCIMYVPYSADHSVLNEYKGATNYPDPNTYTYVEE